MEWNNETIVRLRTLWAEGHSTAEIGRRIGISKNAVVGKAHRLGLTARPSPIRREPAGMVRAPQPRRVVGPTLPPLSDPGPAPHADADPVRPAAIPPAPIPPAPILVQSALAQSGGAPRVGGRAQACCWPLGDPGSKTFRFCDAQSVPSKPYCAEHAQVAYVRVRDRREEAA